MFPHLAIAAAAVLLVADPAPGPGPDAPAGSEAQNLASQLGHTVGAARECAIDPARADAATKKAEDMVSRQASQDGEDDLEMNDRFHEAMEEGRDGVLDRTVDCGQTETELKKLEGDRRY